MGFGVGDKLCCHQRPLGGFLVGGGSELGYFWGRSYLTGVFGSCPDVTSSSSGATRDEA